MLVMLINLRGVKESGSVFAIPTYFFLVLMFVTVGFGFVRYLTGTLGVVQNPPSIEMTQTMTSIGLFHPARVCQRNHRADRCGSHLQRHPGVQGAKKPQRRHDLDLDVGHSGTLFLGITFLSTKIEAVPSEVETVISQLARTVFPSSDVMYLLIIASTTLILIMAANTSFADFPRASALVAADGFLPRQLTFKGSRLVFSRGIVALALIASLLIILLGASVTGLIPLYAIGVFLSFTLSQSGMACRWHKSGPPAPDWPPMRPALP